MVSLLRKEAVAGVSVFLQAQGTLAQAYLLLLLLALSLGATLLVRPFARPLLTALELLSLAALCLSVFAGLFFLGSRDPASPFFLRGTDYALAPPLRWVLFLLVLLPNAAFFFRIV